MCNQNIIHTNINKDIVLRFTLLGLIFFFVVPLSTGQVSTKLDSILSQTLDSMRLKLNVKSLSAAIQIGENEYWQSASGISSLNPTIKAKPEDVYLIGSVVKTMTAACILQLVDEGKLTLNDSIGSWLPDMPFTNRNITIRQLLRHQSGLYDFLNNPNSQPAFLANPDSIWTQESLLKTFMKAPIAAPGGGWSYCNTNYILLGMIIKKATGREFHEEYRSRFFTPLMMNSTAIPAFENLTAPVAHVWIDLNGDGITDDAHDFYSNWLSLNSAASSAGGYYSTALETSRWMRSFMKGNLVSAPIMQIAFQTIAAPGLPGGTYGLGIMKKSFNNLVGFGHQGDLAYCASSWYFPSKDIAITILCNDAKVNSHALAPAISVLQKKYMDYQTNVSSVDNIEDVSIKISAFPSPFDDQINLQFEGLQNTQRVDIKVIDISGIVLKELKDIEINKDNHGITLDQASTWPSGSFVISVTSEQKWQKSVVVVK